MWRRLRAALFGPVSATAIAAAPAAVAGTDVTVPLSDAQIQQALNELTEGDTAALTADQAHAVDVTPLHDAVFEVQRLVLQSDGQAWQTSAPQLQDILRAVDPNLCQSAGDWTMCHANVEIEFGLLGQDTPARQYWGFAERSDGARCVLNAIVPLDRARAFNAVFSELEFYAGPESVGRDNQGLWQASAVAAEHLSQPEVMAKECAELD